MGSEMPAAAAIPAVVVASKPRSANRRVATSINCLRRSGAFNLDIFKCRNVLLSILHRKVTPETVLLFHSHSLQPFPRYHRPSMSHPIAPTSSKSPTKPRILTGDTPTGKLHIGHYVGSVENRLALQNEYDSYFIIANKHAFTTRADKPD